jgi:two-component system osmolarity sensor histidine kinase EnvZ
LQAKNLHKQKEIISEVFKKLSPKTLFGRFLLIIVTPVILLQLLTTVIFYRNHWGSISRNMVASLTGEISLISNGIANVKPEERKYILLTAKQYMTLKAEIIENKQIDDANNLNDEYRFLLNSLKTQTDRKISIFKDGEDDNLRVEIQINKDILSIVFSDKRVANPTTYIFVMWVIGSALLLILVSIIFMRNQIRSITSLTEAAEKFGKGLEITNFKPVGATEIRQAGIAFIEMKERIKRLIETRTQMLAGVSHDLRTPLTRMKLILSLLADKEKKESLEQEVNEMQKMIEGYLNFAQLEVTKSFSEPQLEVNLRKFIDDISIKYLSFTNVKINVNITDNIFVKIRPEYFSRAIQNLIDNSVKFSRYVLIRAQKEENKFTHIFIDDDGIGIPEDKYEDVFQPFSRIDEARNMDNGGVGLGLTIARDIVHKNGGEIKLSKSHLGGLRVTITIPF